jgi:hypothetical protein
MAEENRSRRREKQQGAPRGSTTMPGNDKLTQSHEHQQRQYVRQRTKSRQYQDQQMHDGNGDEKKRKLTNRRQTPVSDKSHDPIASAPFSTDPSITQEGGRQRKEARLPPYSKVGFRSDKTKRMTGGKSEGVVKAQPKTSQKVAVKAEQQQLRDKEGTRKVIMTNKIRQTGDGATAKCESVMKEVGVGDAGKPRRTDRIEEEMTEKEFIFRIPATERSAKFPDDDFYCQACNLHLRNLGKCKQHVQLTKHRNNAKIKTELCALKDLPIPTREQLQSITHLLTQVYHTYGLHKEDDLVKRQEVFKQLASITDETFPGICTTTVDALCL